MRKKEREYGLIKRLVFAFMRITQIASISSWLSGRLWLRPALYCLAAVGVVGLATLTDQFFPESVWFEVSQKAIKDLLSIIASSMLAVAIFSVSVMNSSYASAINASTPRAFEIVIADNSTKQALSSFIGAFIFAVVGIIGINFSSFGDAGRMVMFIMTLWVFAWVVGTFVYWIDYVTRLGQMRGVVQRVATAAEKSLYTYLRAPAGGGTLMRNDRTPPLGAAVVRADRGGVIRVVRIDELLHLADSHGLEIDVAKRTGTLVGAKDTLCHVSGQVPDDDLKASIRRCFVISSERDPVQDPDMTLRLLAEIADRALSPGVNDPGTATDVLDATVLVFTKAFTRAEADEKEEEDPRVRVPPLTPENLIGAAYEPIARDGSGLVEVAVRLQMSLAAITQVLPDDWKLAACQHGKWALERAETTLKHEWERERVRAAARWTED